MGRTRRNPEDPILIKKYANRRLYDTSRSTYITLDDLCEMIRDKLDFVVLDAKTGEDLTQAVLTQVIVEKEGDGVNLLPTSFLKQVIGYYGDQMNTMMLPSYLQTMMDSFVQNQAQMRAQMTEMNMQIPQTPFAFFEELKKQQQTVMDQAMQFWTQVGKK
jgi:polyhydroxyalkanoate synthesis repressor PhaR